jgi:hypothetical protein
VPFKKIKKCDAFSKKGGRRNFLWKYLHAESSVGS